MPNSDFYIKVLICLVLTVGLPIVKKMVDVKKSCKGPSLKTRLAIAGGPGSRLVRIKSVPTPHKHQLYSRLKERYLASSSKSTVAHLNVPVDTNSPEL